ncbi:MAG: hypothetical protein APF80_01850 [Alphaproteobacteria bacterium BRH_c36]|nr:MAG: hypothetical protein APF80_01850 [Alphaproteobacteria bacterium BRH_c36]
MIPGDLIMSVIEEAHRQRPQSLPLQEINASRAAAAAPAAVNAGSFANTLAAKSGAADPPKSTTQAAHVGAVHTAPKAQGAEVMLQGLLLQSVLEVMLSKQGESLTGQGTAGRMWRSMLAEHIAKEVGPALDLQLFRDAKGRSAENTDGGPWSVQHGRRPASQV